LLPLKPMDQSRYGAYPTIKEFTLKYPINKGSVLLFSYSLILLFYKIEDYTINYSISISLILKGSG
jgi:hypothetical protein